MAKSPQSNLKYTFMHSNVNVYVYQDLKPRKKDQKVIFFSNSPEPEWPLWQNTIKREEIRIQLCAINIPIFWGESKKKKKT